MSNPIKNTLLVNNDDFWLNSGALVRAILRFLSWNYATLLSMSASVNCPLSALHTDSSYTGRN